jgi:hypothetical protein
MVFVIRHSRKRALFVRSFSASMSAIEIATTEEKWFQLCQPGSGKLPKSLPLDNSVLPANLRWLVDEADGCAHDDPLNEIGDGLVDGQRKADVQVDLVVNCGQVAGCG